MAGLSTGERDGKEVGMKWKLRHCGLCVGSNGGFSVRKRYPQCLAESLVNQVPAMFFPQIGWWMLHLELS